MLTHCYQEVGMGSGDRRVVVHDGDDVRDFVDELLTAGSVGAPKLRQLVTASGRAPVTATFR